MPYRKSRVHKAGKSPLDTRRKNVYFYIIWWLNTGDTPE